jgi:hypothetical protein
MTGQISKEGKKHAVAPPGSSSSLPRAGPRRGERGALPEVTRPNRTPRQERTSVVYAAASAVSSVAAATSTCSWRTGRVIASVP